MEIIEKLEFNKIFFMMRTKVNEIILIMEYLKKVLCMVQIEYFKEYKFK